MLLRLGNKKMGIFMTIIFIDLRGKLFVDGALFENGSTLENEVEGGDDVEALAALEVFR